MAKGCSISFPLGEPLLHGKVFTFLGTRAASSSRHFGERNAYYAIPRHMPVHLVRDQGGDRHTITFLQKGAKTLTPRVAHMAWQKWGIQFQMKEGYPHQVKNTATRSVGVWAVGFLCCCGDRGGEGPGLFHACFMPCGMGLLFPTHTIKHLHGGTL